MPEVTKRQRDSRLVSRTVNEILEGVVAAFTSFLITFFLCCGFAAVVGTVIGIETNTSSQTIRFIQMGWQLQLLAQFINVRVASVHLGITPLLLTLVVMGIISAFLARHRQLTYRVALAAAISWLFFTYLVQWALQAAIDDPWYLQIIKMIGVYLCALVPRFLHLFHNFLSTHHTGRQFLPLIDTTCRLLKVIAIVLAVEATIVTLVVVIQNRGSYIRICHLLGMKTVSFAFCVFLTLLWIPNLLIWIALWSMGSTIHIGTVAIYSLDAAKGSRLPLLPFFGLLPPAVSTGTRHLLTTLPWLLTVIVVVLFTLSRHGFGLFAATRSSFVSIRKVENLSERDDDSTVLDEKVAAQADDKSNKATAGSKNKNETHTDVTGKDELLTARQQATKCCGVIARRLATNILPLLAVSAVLSLLTILVVVISRGALGNHALAFVGIHVSQACKTCLVPIIIAIFASWIVTYAICFLLVVIRGRGVTPHLVWQKGSRIMKPLLSRPDRSVSRSSSSEQNHDGSSSSVLRKRTAQSDVKAHKQSDLTGDRNADQGSGDTDTNGEKNTNQPARGDVISGYPQTVAQSATRYFRSGHEPASAAQNNETNAGHPDLGELLSRSPSHASDSVENTDHADTTDKARATGNATVESANTDINVDSTNAPSTVSADVAHRSSGQESKS